MQEIKWEFCMLCAHYLISTLSSAQTLNINEFLNIRITFFWNTTNRQNNAKDKKCKKLWKGISTMGNEPAISKRSFALSDGSVPKYHHATESYWLGQMNIIETSIWD